MEGQGQEDASWRIVAQFRLGRAGVARTSIVSWLLAGAGAILCVVTLACVSDARASTFRWYFGGIGTEDCWQTGQPGGTESHSCDNVNAGFLESRMVNITEGGVTKDFPLADGDYCNYYKIGDTINKKTGTVVSGTTNWEPPSPIERYQESDGHWNVCQAWGNIFGQELENTVTGNECNKTCGMQHYASFSEQKEQDRPWSTAFGSPSLVVSTFDELATFNPSSSAGGWQYVCPELKDTTTGRLLEYCIQLWRSSHDEKPAWEDERIGECNNPFDQTISVIWPSAQFATNNGGHTTIVGGTYYQAHFDFKITEGNLRSAIKLANSSNNGEGGRPKPGVGCKKSENESKLSENPSNYALIGVEQGQEGWSGMEVFGSSMAGLELYSEYTSSTPPDPPFALREPNTGNEDIFYRGSNNALWQEAWTPSGGWKAPAEIGGQLTSDPIGFIEPNGTMNIFYRGANDAIWQAYREPTGHWSTYEVLSGAPLSSGKPYAYIEPNGTMNVFYCSTSNVISQLYYTGSSWTDPGMAVGEAAPCGGDPSAYMKSNGEQNVFYRTTTGNVGQVWWSSSIGWHSNPIEVGGNVVGTVSAYLEANGTQNVVYRTTSNTMGQVWWTQEAGWHNSPLGGEVMGDPDGFVTPNGNQHVFYVNHYGTIGEWYWESASGWHNHELGEAAEGNPTGFAAPGGEMSVFFFQGGQSGVLDQWYYNEKGEWGISSVGAESPPPLLPPVVSTGAPSGIQETQAQLNGTVNPKGTETKYYFEYGTTTSYGSTSGEGNAGSGAEAKPISVTITGLQPNTTYHYWLVATNPDGASHGEDRTFTTLSSGKYTQSIDSGNSLNAVSCVPSTTDCVVSDSKGNAFYATAVSASGPASWTTWSGPGLSPSQAVDCPTTSLCLLADGKGSAGGNLYYATSFGGAWSLAFEPAYGVDAFSCASSSFCIDGQGADGGYIRYATNPGSILWTAEAIAGAVNVSGVSCLSSSFCSAVDSVGSIHVATTTGQIESPSWTTTNVDGSTGLHGVACTSTTSCLAVDGAGNVLKLAIYEGNATSTKQDIDGSNDLTAIACSGSSTCATVDSSGNVFITTNGGTSWTKEYTTVTDLTSISCASTSLCATVDTTGKVTSFVP